MNLLIFEKMKGISSFSGSNEIMLSRVIQYPLK